MTILQYSEDFEKQIRAHPVLLVQFGSHTCSPCGAIQERIEYWRSQHSSAQFLYIPVEQFPELCGQLGVHAVPTVRVYINGQLSIQESGIFSINDILSKTNKYYNMLTASDPN